jgi:hypothetical protein
MTENKIIIGDKKLKQLKNMPLIQTNVSKSKDGKWIINKTTITTIKPIQYFETILANDGEEEIDGVSLELKEDFEKAQEVLEN